MEGHHKGRQGAGGERYGGGRAIIKGKRSGKEQGREMEGHHKGRQGAGERDGGPS